MMKMKKMASGMVLLAGILWGTMGIFVRRLNSAGLQTMDIVFLRSCITTILMTICILCYNRKLLKIRIRDIWCFLGTGLCSVVFFNFCYFQTIQRTSMSVAAVLLYTSPVFVMLLSRILFREKFHKVSVIVLFMTFAGCILVTNVISGSEGAMLDPAGILIGLGAGFGYALYSIFSRYALDRGYHSLTITFYTFILAMIGSALGTDIGHTVTTAVSDWQMLLLVLLLGLVNTVLPYFLYTLGLSYMENSKAAILATIEPVAATVFGIIFFRESLLLTEVLGMLLVLGGIILLSVYNKKKTL